MRGRATIDNKYIKYGSLNRGGGDEGTRNNRQQIYKIWHAWQYFTLWVSYSYSSGYRRSGSSLCTSLNRGREDEGTCNNRQQIYKIWHAWQYLTLWVSYSYSSTYRSSGSSLCTSLNRGGGDEGSCNNRQQIYKIWHAWQYLTLWVSYWDRRTTRCGEWRETTAVDHRYWRCTLYVMMNHQPATIYYSSYSSSGSSLCTSLWHAWQYLTLWGGRWGDMQQ